MQYTSATAQQTQPDRLPNEFQYFEHQNSTMAKGLRAGLSALFRTSITLPDDVVRTYGYTYYDADPIAEAFVDEVYMQQGQAAGRAMLDKALNDGVETVSDAPDSLRTLFAELEVDPPWVDWDTVDHGAAMFRRFGTDMFSFAGAITLQGYRESSVAKPLAFTGAYGGATANKRFLETARFWLDVASPDGMRRGGQGVATAIKVRIMHVFVRRRLLQHPQWQLYDWGVPISQGDAILTLMGGSFLPGYLMKLMGYRTTRTEIEAMMHFWRYVGHVMGVQPRWYPSTVAEAAGLMYTSIIKAAGTSGDDGKFLSQSYLESYKPTDDDTGWARVAKAMDYRRQLGFVTWYVPMPSHRHYELPKAGLWSLYPALGIPRRFAEDTLRRHSRFAAEHIDQRARKQAQKWVRSRLGPRSADFAAVESFTR